MNNTKDLKKDAYLHKAKNKIGIKMKQDSRPKNHQLIVVESSADT